MSPGLPLPAPRDSACDTSHRSFKLRRSLPHPVPGPASVNLPGATRAGPSIPEACQAEGSQAAGGPATSAPLGRRPSEKRPVGWPDWFCDFLELSTHRGGRAGTPAHLLQGRFATPSSTQHTPPPRGQSGPRDTERSCTLSFLGDLGPAGGKSSAHNGQNDSETGGGREEPGGEQPHPALSGPLRPQKARPPRLSRRIPRKVQRHNLPTTRNPAAPCCGPQAHRNP